MKLNRRTLFWTGFLSLTALLAVLPEYFPPPGEQLADPTRPPAPASQEDSEEPGDAQPDKPAPGNGLEQGSKRNLFAAKSWYVPPPPPPSLAAAQARALPPPAPGIPPLPFSYLGKLEDGTSNKAFLQREEMAYVVAQGDIIDGMYRVERIQPDTLTLIYLPLGVAQTLFVGNPL